MSDSDSSGDTSSVGKDTSSVSNVNCKHSKSVYILWILLLLIILIIGGITVQTGTNKTMGWVLYSMSVLLGLIALVFLISGKKLRKYGFPVVLLVLTIFNLVAMVLAKPQASFGQVFTAHFINMLFGISSIVSIILLK